MHEVLVNRLGGLSLPRKSVVRLTDCPNMTLDVYRGRKTTMQQQQQQVLSNCVIQCFYGAEIRGCGYSEEIEKVQTAFCKQSIGSKQNTMDSY